MVGIGDFGETDPGPAAPTPGPNASRRQLSTEKFS